MWQNDDTPQSHEEIGEDECSTEYEEVAIFEDGAVVQALDTADLHASVDREKVLSNLLLSPVQWKASPQMTHLEEKHVAAICGSVVVGVEPASPSVSDEEAVPDDFPTLQSEPTPQSRRVRGKGKGQGAADASGKSRSRGVVRVSMPTNVEKLEKSLCSAMPTLFSFLANPKEEETANEPEAGGGRSRRKRSLPQWLREEFSSPEIKTTIHDFVPIPVEKRPQPSEPTTTVSRGRGKGGRGKRSRMSIEPLSTEKVALDGVAEVHDESDVLLSPNMSTSGRIETCTHCGVASNQCITLYRFDNVNVDGSAAQEEHHLCEKCCHWLHNFLISLTATNQVACIAPRPCYALHMDDCDMDTSMENGDDVAGEHQLNKAPRRRHVDDSLLCKQCKFHTFVAELGLLSMLKCFALTRDMPPAAKNILTALHRHNLSKESTHDTDALRQSHLVVEARIARCEEYARSLSILRRAGINRVTNENEESSVLKCMEDRHVDLVKGCVEKRHNWSIRGGTGTGTGTGGVVEDTDEQQHEDVDYYEVRRISNCVTTKCHLCGAAECGNFMCVATQTCICHQCLTRHQTMQPVDNGKCEKLCKPGDDDDDVEMRETTTCSVEQGALCDVCFHAEMCRKIPTVTCHTPRTVNSTSRSHNKSSTSTSSSLSSSSSSLLHRRRVSYVWECGIVECRVCHNTPTDVDAIIPLDSSAVLLDPITLLSHTHISTITLYRLFSAHENSSLLCEYCLWTFLAAITRKKDLVPYLSCSKGGSCKLQECDACLVDRCFRLLPPDDALPLTPLARHLLQSTENCIREEKYADIDWSKFDTSLSSSGHPNPKSKSAAVSSANCNNNNNNNNKVRVKMPLNVSSSQCTSDVPYRPRVGELVMKVGPQRVMSSQEMAHCNNGPRVKRVLSSPPCDNSGGVPPHLHLSPILPEREAMLLECGKKNAVEEACSRSTLWNGTSPPLVPPARTACRTKVPNGILTEAPVAAVGSGTSGSSSPPEKVEGSCDSGSEITQSVGGMKEPDVLSPREEKPELVVPLASVPTPHTSLLPKKSACATCGSEGGNMLSCVTCHEPYHFFCIGRTFRPKKCRGDSSFVCRNCTKCKLCDQSSCDLHCVMCVNFYHVSCLHDYPPAQGPCDLATWTCPQCAKCDSCERTFVDAKSALSQIHMSTNCQTVWSSQCHLCLQCARADNTIITNGDVNRTTLPQYDGACYRSEEEEDDENQASVPMASLGVFKSGIHARGVFTLNDVSAHCGLIEYVGEVIRWEIVRQRETRYRAQGLDCYLLQLDEDHVLDATRMGNIARYINHSCQPNAYAKVVPVAGQSRSRVMIFALRDIRAGEEITFDYAFPREDEQDRIPCKCGAAQCRLYIN